jgi:Flp pilus assembly protein TadD
MGFRKHVREILACALLTVSVLVTYAPAARFGFINFDDPDYVSENAHVQAGLTRAGLAWAFFNLHGEHTYWHPVTWVSHMLDCQLFGVNPGAHHLVNAIFHAANAVLLFLLLKQMTAAFWRSLLVAALFALHPLQVDTVAWITERKNVLSTLFWLLATMAYVRYARRTDKPGIQDLSARHRQPIAKELPSAPSATRRPPPFGSRFLTFDYFLPLLLFALGLMSKPALVTLPFVFLLLDYWPLGRFTVQGCRLPWPALRRLIGEKIPFFMLSSAAVLVTIAAHVQLGAHSTSMSALARIENALVSYVRYLGKIFWPQNLSVFYPHPRSWPAAEIAASLVLLAAITAVVCWHARRRPYLVVGWFWFLGVMIPMSGIIQAGAQAMADRFAYVPIIGVLLAVVWAGAQWAQDRRLARFVVAGISVAVVGGCMAATSIQLPHWMNSETLFRHALRVTRDNYLAHDQLGTALAEQGRIEEARSELAAALRLRPRYAPALSSMSKILYTEGNFEEAVRMLRVILEQYPDDALARSNLGMALAGAGKLEDALREYQKSIELQPKSPEALNNFAWLLATHKNPGVRDGQQAVSLAERACDLSGRTNLWFLSTLAAAYAEAGRFGEAVSTQRRVCDMARAAGLAGITNSFQRRLEAYGAGHAYTQP